MIKVKILFGQNQKISFSDGTFVEFSIVDKGNNVGEMTILTTDNNHFLNLYKNGKMVNLNLNGDTYSFNNETIKFVNDN